MTITRSQRWAHHFRAHLECVVCRSTKQTHLYDLPTGQVLMGDMFSLEDWHARVAATEVFCDACGFRPTWRARTPGRLAAKREAARLADVTAASTSLMAYYDADKPVPTPRDTSLTGRFWAKVDRAGTDGCWLWTGATDRDGFGLLRDAEGRMRPVHRIAWEMARGPIPQGAKVRHSCRNLHCVNENHLVLA